MARNHIRFRVCVLDGIPKCFSVYANSKAEALDKFVKRLIVEEAR